MDVRGPLTFGLRVADVVRPNQAEVSSAPTNEKVMSQLAVYSKY